VPNPNPVDGGSPLVCGASCVPKFGGCTTNADCCPGIACVLPPGSITGSCGAVPPPPNDGGVSDGGATDGGATDGGATDGGATDGGVTDAGSTDAGGGTDTGPGCSLYGQTCTTGANCCDGVPCTGGRCIFLP
jgi:hypothetical protein